MKKSLLSTFLVVCVFGTFFYLSQATAERATFDNWLVRVNVNEVIGAKTYLVHDRGFENWHHAIEDVEQMFDWFPLGDNTARKITLKLADLTYEEYTIYPGLQVVHSDACELVEDDPVQAYRYAFSGAC